MEVANRVFSLTDQRTFAEWSRDFNPIHIDPVLARRMPFGAVVVHGVHGILWAVDAWLGTVEVPTKIVRLTAAFQNPVYLGVSTTCQVQPIKDNRVSMQIHSGGRLCTQLTIEVASENQKDPVETVASIQNADGVVQLNEARAAQGNSLPNIKAFLPTSQIANILATTEIVGMHCPGENSLFANIDLHFAVHLADRRATSLQYKVNHFHEKFKLLVIGLASETMSGELKAFRNNPPAAQESYSRYLEYSATRDFSKERALVIGGSRGLGEVVTKILVACGADVLSTFCTGKADAERLMSEIKTATPEARLTMVPFDITTDKIAASIPQNWSPTHLYYFATPFITAGDPKQFNNELFRRFSSFYVDAFARIVEDLQPLGLGNIFYPSTVFLDSLPPHMAAYTAAKSAGERLLKTLERESGYNIWAPRLPMLGTDQTTQVFKGSSADTTNVMLREIDAFHRTRI